MDIQQLINDLHVANEELEKAVDLQETLEDRLAREEAPLLIKFIDQIKHLAETETKYIHNAPCVLLYEFDENGKTLISPKVYLKPDGDVVYEVFDEEGFRYHRPNAIIINNYNIITLQEFLLVCPMYEIIEFYQESCNELKKETEKIMKRIESRRKSIEQMKEL